MSATDAEIVAASIDDPVRFAEIFDRHADEIRRFAAARVGRAAADDVAAETFRIAFERRRSFDLGVRNALPWLYGIATNLVRRERRGHTRYHAALGRLSGRREISGESMVDLAGQLDARTDLMELRAALRTLSTDELDVLLLVAWEQLSPADAGSVLGIPPETARTRLFRARQRVRRHVTDDQPDLEETTDATR